MPRTRERGAAMVEFALVSMLLVTLVIGIVEFGYAFFVEGTLGGAAREGARNFAISSTPSTAVSNAVTAVQTAALPITLPPSEIAIVPATCTPGVPVTVTITHAHTTLTGFFSSSFTLTAKGTMRCGG